MKNKILILTICITMIFSFTSCSSNEQNTNNNNEIENLETKNSTSTTEENMNQEIILNMNGTEVRATLNDNTIANEFVKLLPYNVTVSRAADDLCGSVSEQLTSVASENSDGWKIGEIGWFGGWFTILLDNQENFSSMSVPIIGTINPEDLSFVQSLTGRIEIKITLAE